MSPEQERERVFRDRLCKMKHSISIAALATLPLFLCVLFGSLAALAQKTGIWISFLVVDPSGRPLPGVRLVLQSPSETKIVASSASDGTSSITIPSFGAYIVHADSAGSLTSRSSMI